MTKRATAIMAAAIGFLAGVLLCFLALRFLLPGRTENPRDNASAERELTDLALRAAEAMKAGDYQTLSELVHPDTGLVLCPIATVNLNSNLTFTPAEVAKFGSNTDKLTWGVRADGGEPITMTVSEYFRTFVMDRDYTAAPVIGVNFTVRVGNSLENTADTFPGAQVVDLCFPGTPEAQYTDWSILRFVFQKNGEKLLLTALIHSESAL